MSPTRQPAYVLEAQEAQLEQHVAPLERGVLVVVGAHDPGVGDPVVPQPRLRDGERPAVLRRARRLPGQRLAVVVDPPPLLGRMRRIGVVVERLATQCGEPFLTRRLGMGTGYPACRASHAEPEAPAYTSVVRLIGPA